LGGGGLAAMINGKGGQSEGATSIHDNRMVCANASASAASSMTAASKGAGDIRVQHYY